MTEGTTTKTTQNSSRGKAKVLQFTSTPYLNGLDYRRTRFEQAQRNNLPQQTARSEASQLTKEVR
eukprot:scaffold1390_cov172-Amphora_coffeaeformis.AAC.8